MKKTILSLFASFALVVTGLTVVIPAGTVSAINVFQNACGGNSGTGTGTGSGSNTNPAACAAVSSQTNGGTKWVRTNKPGEPEAWGCEYVNPNEGNEKDDDDPATPVTPGSTQGDKVTGRCGEEARTNLIRCETEGGAAAFNNVLRIFVIVLSFGIGIAAIGGLAFSAIQYAQASDNEGSVSAARERIRNIVIGLFLYGFLLAIVNWLIPGGMFG